MKKLLLAIDIQNEYIANGRPFNITSIQPSLDKAKQALNWAREKTIPVWHIQHAQDKNVFVKGTPGVEFIDGFYPIADEKRFTKSMYSCFSSDEFTAAISEYAPDEIMIIGYGSSMCCLCTIIDGIHRGYKFTLIEDATASRSFPHANEADMHTSAINVLRQYANIISLDDIRKRDL